MSDDKSFFDKQTPSSKIKAMIVANYFPAYCSIIMKPGQKQIRYLDLFAGPGIYKDGSFSTPILLADNIAADLQLKQVVRLMFNDFEHIDTLKANFNTRYPEGTFHFETRFGDKTVGEDVKINEYLKKLVKDKKNPHPTLLFVDPFGYKGINTIILAEFLKNWGNEIFLFLNIKRVHAAVENNKFDALMQELFPTMLDKIRQDRKYTSSVFDRLVLIIQSIKQEFNNITQKNLFFTAFRFQEEDSNATSHFILHFTKDAKGYELIKQVYQDFDNVGAALHNNTYTFDAKLLNKDQTILFELQDENVPRLAELLLKDFAGKTISAQQLYEKHQATTPYSRRVYAEALRQLAQNDKIFSKFTDAGKHKFAVLISNTCILKFN